MKKLLLISVIGLLLAGCGDKKITKDFLNGDWICNQKVFKEIDLNSDYKDPVETIRQKRIFKFDGDDLYAYSSLSGEKDSLIQIDAINNDTEEVDDSSDKKTTTISRFAKDNADQWTWIYETKVFSKTPDLNDSKEKYETVCTRIK